MISYKVVLTVPIILAAALSEDLLTCLLQPDLTLCEEYLQDITAEISLVFIPSILSLLAVIVVSVFAFKLQLRMAREVQPTVNIDGLEESREPQKQNNEDRNEANGSEFEASTTCFGPLSVVVERIMMLNIAALILVLIFISNNCIRLYFIVTREKCDEISLVFIRLIKFLCFLLGTLYVVVIRKKLCT